MTLLVAAAFLIGPSLPVASSRGVKPLFTIGVQAVGKVSKDDLRAVAQSLKRWWVAVRVLPSSQAPKRFLLSSGRYQAQPWAEEVERGIPKGIDKVLILTSVELSARREGVEDWRILGYSAHKGKVALVSQSRLQGLTVGSEKISKSDLTVRLALHEISGCFGVEECYWTKCLGYPHRGSVKRLAETTFQFCPRCSNTLWQVGVII